MKVLFAVNNDNVSEAIVKKYQKEYKEILSYKNVYYFNAILRELQKDKSYSRIVISEDLEPFANNNYASIDKFLFEKYSTISEEAKSINNENIDIILICADRRKKTDNMLAKVYKKEIYNAIIGQDRSIEEVCRLIKHPRDKEEAKRYYSIQESELGESESETSVSEAEVENIRAHYARIGKNEDKYIESFNNIVAQYTDTQLRIIIKYLPMNVKAVLEEKSPKYQQLVTSSAMSGIDVRKKTASYKELIKNKKDEDDELVKSDVYKENDEVIEQLIKPKNIKSVVIPNSLKTSNVQKVVIPEINKPEINFDKMKLNIPEEKIQKKTSIDLEELNDNNKEKELLEDRVDDTPVKTNIIGEEKNDEKIQVMNDVTEQEEVKTPKKGRGRPRKNPVQEVDTNSNVQSETKQDENEIDLFNIEENEQKNVYQDDELITLKGNGENEKINLFSMDEKDLKQEVDLFGMEDEKESEEEVDLFNIENEEETEEEVDLFNIEEEQEQKQEEEVDLFNTENKEDIDTASNSKFKEAETLQTQKIQKVTVLPNKLTQEQNLQNNYIARTSNSNTNFNTLLTGDKKIVAFVGTTKNGTSFIVNNTAEMLSSMGIETAILDLTKTKNAYYIYTDDKENLRTIARKCMENLNNGIAEGIEVKKNLTVYTEMPGDEKEYNIETILATLLKKYSAILIDTDFETTPEVFEKTQEIYLVQTMDVLTIQPLTAFLRNLKSKEILKPEKLRIVINKAEKVRSLSVKTLIGGMSCYNAPSMTYMTELFDKDNIKYCEIPFEIQNYVKYLDSLVNCSITLNGYTKQFIMSLRELANMVYPLVNKQAYAPMGGKKIKKDPFSNQVNDTLNKMRNKY